MRRPIFATLATALSCLSAPCLAEQAPPVANQQPAGQPAPADRGGRPIPADGLSVAVGFAPVFSPAWQGSKDMALSVFPDLRLAYKDAVFASVPDGIGWNAVNRDGWKAGPVVKIRFGRDEDDGGSPFLIAGGSDALRGMGNVSAAGEAGAFVEKRFGRRGAWRVRAEMRHGFGGHEGLLADASAAYRLTAGRSIVSVGPRATFASAPFMRTYFGVDGEQSQRTGLAPYDPGAGIVSYGVGGVLIRPTGRRSAITVFAGFDRLGGEAGRSPLVRERGRRNQFSLGAGYSLRFRL